METRRGRLRLLLLQIRRDPTIRREEHASFANYAGLARSQVDILNVFDTPDFALDVADGYDALLIGGASDASVLEPDSYPFVLRAQELLRRSADRAQPVFASCFGFQLAVLALGGEITRKPELFELGSLPMRLTPEAGQDPLLNDAPDGFLAICGHREQATSLPDDCTLLAETDLCCEAFRLKGRPFWAFQFHPELDRATLVQRLTAYRDQYTRDAGHYDEVVAAVQDTPASNRLPRKFVDAVLLVDGD